MFPVPSVFIMLKILHFPFPAIEPPHILTLWCFLLQAGHVAGRTLGEILHLNCIVWQLVDVYAQGATCGRAGMWMA